MIVISDTNILSSFAAATAFEHIAQLFPQAQVSVPPGVRHELQAGLDRGRTYLQTPLEAIDKGQITVLTLTPDETILLASYPTRLNQGEREAIALAATRRATLLSNDNRAISYCRQQQVRVLSLVDLLRLLWVRRIVSQEAVLAMIAQMRQVEQLTLKPEQEQVVFAPRRQG